MFVQARRNPGARLEPDGYDEDYLILYVTGIEEVCIVETERLAELAEAHEYSWLRAPRDALLIPLEDIERAATDLVRAWDQAEPPISESDIEFLIGEKYQNRGFAFTVLAVDHEDDTLSVRLDDSTERELSLSQQQRILAKMQREQRARTTRVRPSLGGRIAARLLRLSPRAQ